VAAAPGALAPEELREGRVTTGTGGNTPAFPAQWFTAYFALSSVSQTLLSPSSAMMRMHRRQRGASLGAPGPHDFAVRVGVVRLATPSRPPHPLPNVRDDRDTPLLRAGTRPVITNFGKKEREIFLREGLDNPNQLETVRKNSILRASYRRAFGRLEPGRVRNMIEDSPVGQDQMTAEHAQSRQAAASTSA
jgi:hypothetical protein